MSSSCTRVCTCIGLSFPPFHQVLALFPNSNHLYTSQSRHWSLEFCTSHAVLFYLRQMLPEKRDAANRAASSGRTSFTRSRLTQLFQCFVSQLRALFYFCSQLKNSFSCEFAFPRLRTFGHKWANPPQQRQIHKCQKGVRETVLFSNAAHNALENLVSSEMRRKHPWGNLQFLSINFNVNR